MFDEDNLVSHAGLVPLLELAAQTGLSQLFDEHVRFADERIRSGATNATAKLTAIIAGMAAGADSIDDLDVIRSGGMKNLFGGVYAAPTLGIFPREFTHGFPVWRYHPFFTNSLETVTQADITHRRHAICETVRADLIDGPWAHQPSGWFPANAAWCILAAICHNLLRAADTLPATARYTVARGATLRAHLIAIPARLARPQRRPVLHLPAHWPRATAWLKLWTAVHTT